MAKSNARPYLPVFSVDEGRLLLEEGEYRVQHLGLTFAHRVEGMGWFRDILAKLNDFFSGNVGTYNSSVQSRLIVPALREMSDRAHELYASDLDGAPDAIVGFAMAVTPMSSKGMSMMQVTMYGTVVKLHKVPDRTAGDTTLAPQAHDSVHAV